MPLPRNLRQRNAKFDSNIQKRGKVSRGKAEERTDEPTMSKGLIAMFLILVVGSSLVEVLNLFGRAPSLGGDDAGEQDAGAGTDGA
mmetsp:Transcript_7433/g.10680  ORF Transcript_7433/g.10680 Transcript_7433/m.10680 type:complete len:86 (+) Transcript_7433:56-313(+)